jgi:imidazole glycerol-phosphate synthase subunit HisF
MLKKRIIPCLDIRNGRTVKGINFKYLKDAGDPVELAKRYEEQGADELVFLDITATIEERKAFIPLIETISSEISIPFTVGGGIKDISNVRSLLKAGADKVSVNSFAVKYPEIITDLSGQFGSQCVVVAIDTKYTDGRWKVYINGGQTPTDLNADEWAKEVEKAGAGEILLTSMDHDGTKNGFAIEILNKICNSVRIPVIASGGAGKMEHFSDLFENTECTAALAAGIFHYGEITIPSLKNFLKTKKIDIR